MNTSAVLQAAWPLAFALSACQAPPPPPGPLSDEDVEAIRSVTQVWADATRIGDGGLMGALYTEDGVEMPPDAPEANGRNAIQIQVEMTRGRSDFSATSVETDGRDDLAYDRGILSLTVTSTAQPTTETGKYLAIMRRQADGSWLISRLIWNSDLPSGTGSTGTESIE